MGRGVVDNTESIYHKAQLPNATGTSGSSRYGAKLVAGQLDLLQLRETRGEAPREALENLQAHEVILCSYLDVVS